MPASFRPFSLSIRLRASVYALALLATIAFSTLDEGWTALVLGVAAVTISWLLVESPRAVRIPKVLINSVVVVASCYLWYQLQSDFDNINLLTTLGQFIIALMLCKLFERKGRRDLVQLIILSLLVVVATSMFSSSMLFAGVLLAYFGTLVYCVAVFHLDFHATLGGAGGLVVMPAPREAPVFRRDLRRMTWLAVAVLLLLSFVVFLAIPRSRGRMVGASFLTGWGSGGAGVTFQTGFNNTVQFHDFGQLNESDAVVMEVRLSQRGLNIGSEMYEPYFRGLTLDVYDPTRRLWQRSYDTRSGGIADGTQIPFEGTAAQLLPEDQINDASLIIQEYRLQSPPGHLLFHVAPAAGVSSDQFSAVVYNPKDQLLRFMGITPRVLQYTVMSLPVFDPGASLLQARSGERGGGAAETAPAAERPTRAATTSASQPGGDGREVPAEVAALARTIANDLLPPEGTSLTAERARQVTLKFEEYLRTNYPYSLEFRQVDRALDPTADFLLNRKETGGHCEYFASAMAMLCRSVGIPSRLVTGYRGGEYNSISGYYTVRQKHAHAWAELYMPGKGWVQSDPSPISSNVDYSEAIIRRWAQELWQIVQNTWMLSVVSFDNDSRRNFIAWLQERVAGIRQLFADAWGAVAFGMTGPQADLYMRLTLIGPAFGIAVVGVWLYRRWRQERLLREGPGKYRRPVKLSMDAHFVDELLRLVARKSGASGKIRKPEQTPLEYIDASAPTLGPAHPDARWLVQTFYALRYGTVSVTAELRNQISASLRRVRDALSHVEPRPQVLTKQ
jgi:transglutaminase-like putative cysteine protease